MTKEEAINILQKVVDWKHDSLRGHPEMRYIAEAVEVILPQPSLPSNLDEAANDYIFIHEYAPSTGNHPWADAFKAGAEWMAGQGVSVDGKVIMDFSEPYDIINRRLIAKLGDALLEIEPGEVVVQIRKK